MYCVNTSSSLNEVIYFIIIITESAFRDRRPAELAKWSLDPLIGIYTNDMPKHVNGITTVPQEQFCSKSEAICFSCRYYKVA